MSSVVVHRSPAVGRLVTLAQQQSYDVCVVPTPDGRKFVDVPALAEQTGYPVRSYYKQPGEPDLLPPADAFVEAYGLGKPIVAMPYTSSLMAMHPCSRRTSASSAVGRASALW